MATKNYENGIVSVSSGASEDITSDIMTTGAVFWVDSVTGNDANAGTNRNSPKATIASANTAATVNNGDIIIALSTHTEILTSSIALKAGVRLFGMGTGSSKPSFTINGNIDAFNMSAARVEIHNVKFPAGTAAHTAAVNFAASGCRVTNCDFTLSTNDLDTITVTATGLDCTVEGCTFTISGDGPDRAISVESASAAGLKVIECQFDGGDYDFDDAAIYSAVAHTEFLYQKNVLTNKASIIHTAAAKGQAVGTIADDTCRVEI